MIFKYTNRFKMIFLLGMFNIFNVLDKALTYVALKNPSSSELNPIARYFIERFGIMTSVMVYCIILLVISYVVYKIMAGKRLVLERYNLMPETFFLWLNIVFCLIIINNVYWLWLMKA